MTKTLISKWKYKLQSVEKSIADYEHILNSNELNSDMRSFLNSELKSKRNYRDLVSETIKTLEGE